jgi:SH3-like domain-containing protein
MGSISSCWRWGCVLVIVAFLSPLSSIAQSASNGTGLPLPRFVSLRASEVNMRAGPGVRYPVDWVYKRQDLPVEVIAEFGTWRKVRDVEGTQGWVHQTMLSNRRTVAIRGDSHTLRRQPRADGDAIAMVEPGVIGNLIECPGDSEWCRVKVDQYVGWLQRTDFWGSYPGETVN